jgi:hypothetical protein
MAHDYATAYYFNGGHSDPVCSAVRIVARTFPEAGLSPLMHQIDEEDGRPAQRRDEVHERRSTVPAARSDNANQKEISK